MSDHSQHYRFVIEGWCNPIFLGAMVEDAKKLTSEDGGFTLSLGTHADVEIRRQP